MTNSKSIVLPRKIEVSREVLFHEIEGEIVLLNMKNEQYFGLDEVGTRFWILLSRNLGTEEVFNILLKEFNVDKEVLKNDLSALITDLNNQGLVKIAD